MSQDLLEESAACKNIALPHLNLKCIRVTIATITLLRNSAHSQAEYIPFKDIIIIPSPLKACAKKEIHMGASIVESSLPTDKRFFRFPTRENNSVFISPSINCLQ